jgi:hypothetical protein
VAALREARTAGLTHFQDEPAVIAGRYGLSSKEFNPAMVKAVFDELARTRPMPHFTVGINDDVTHLSLPVETEFDIEAADVVRAVFYGLGSDGTVGANKNSVKIIAEETRAAQGCWSTTQEIGRGHGVAPAFRSPPHPLDPPHPPSAVACNSSCSNATMSRDGGPGRGVPPERALRWTTEHPAARGAAEGLGQGLKVYHLTPCMAREAGLGGASTICRPASSRSPGSSPRTRLSPHQGCDQRRTRSAARR